VKFSEPKKPKCNIFSHFFGSFYILSADLREELIEAERQIARGEVVSHQEAKKRIKENLAKWK
jgi:hypothetical protein